MQHDSSVSTHPGGRHPAKQRASVQREVVRLLDELAPEKPPPRHGSPATAIRLHRTPDRCILQGETHAVSVSWFPGRADDGSLGEIMVIAWRGVVAQPGSGQRPSAPAVVISEQVALPVEDENGGWEWRLDGADPAYATASLAAYCRELLAS